MRKKIFTAIAVAGVSVVSFAGAADAKGHSPANGACVAAGVKSLQGAIGGVASSSAPGTIATVIAAHVNGTATICATL